MKTYWENFFWDDYDVDVFLLIFSFVASTIPTTIGLQLVRVYTHPTSKKKKKRYVCKSAKKKSSMCH